MYSRNAVLSSIFKFSQIGIVVLDKDGVLLDVNDFMFESMCAPPEQFLDKRFGNFFRCAVVAENGKICGYADECKICEIRNGLVCVLKEKTELIGIQISHSFEMNGENIKKTFTINAIPHKIEHEDYVAVTFIDNTKSLLLEFELGQSHKKYKNLFENITQGVALHEIIFDDEGKPEDYLFLEANPVFEKITGLKSNSVVGKSVKDIIPIVDNQWFDIYEKASLGEAPYRCESFIKDFGKYYDVRAFCPEKDKFAVIISDITEQKELEVYLRISENRFKNYIDNAPIGIFVLSKSGVVKDANRKGCIQTGYEKAEIIGMNISDLVYFKNHLSTSNAFKEITKDASFSVGLPYIRKDFEERFWDMEGIKLGDDDSLVFTTDTTDKKVIEEKLKYAYYHDELSGLYNRKYINDNLSKIDNANKLPLSVILADINGLKIYNDAFGYSSGDYIIKMVAHALEEICVKIGVVARWSGDAFIVFLNNCGFMEAEKTVYKIKQRLLDVQIGNETVSVSFGIATKIDKEEPIVSVFKDAEDSLLKNKAYEESSVRSKTTNMILKTLHEKNKREEQHSIRVSKICECFAAALGFSEEDINKLRVIGLVHDIGKIGIDENILNKQGKLSSNESKEMKRHPEIGYRILSSTNETSELAFHVLSHHERLDGTGYPNGIKGENISLWTRILTIADSYDAITSTRTYRDGISKEEAARELLENAGTQFDEELVNIFIQKVMTILD